MKKKKKLHPFKCSDETWQVIKEKADKYANGNVSAWLRWAAVNAPPPKKGGIQ